MVIREGDLFTLVNNGEGPSYLHWWPVEKDPLTLVVRIKVSSYIDDQCRSYIGYIGGQLIEKEPLTMLVSE